MDKIILFDGECNFCDNSVQFMIKRDKNARFSFASLQSENGRKLLEQYKAPSDLDSFVLIENGQFHTQSSAALRVCKSLDGAWKLLVTLLIVPRPIRDFFYTTLAKNRYKWFGKKDQCMLPSKEQKKRFLSI
ncbi:thiol-disulfide oxidoreductase DCC family protein [Halobacillus locisalis]|uniref:Thiol-disulfide oxidoreductase DCC family protein n=1 Tax=Halobacillus locisalis TaxID=220753 RepID=A0A838CWC9_9BACI|nr:thiol-disulfide oxidoreductase DCC family protein [Halobacillus locisalis]MBA2176270.1 thiol-disulfide oxidoreductase DCC family protein [Halobacillus locisalis]